MAADFFTNQDRARRNTTRLVVLFVLAVAAIVASINVLLAATLGYLGRDPGTGTLDWTLVFDPAIVGLSVVGTLVVVGGGSLYKVAQLAAGGHVVAEALGGRRLDPSTKDEAAQKVLNVVEEMAIASGVPAPPVFLLDGERGINAFAAGFSPGDAVIGITRGAVEHLTRDELQGVVAHEFSHILNGDMRLNIRLMGVLHGILIIGMLGYFLVRMTAFSGHRGRRSSRDSGGGAVLAILGLGAGLMAAGFFGTLFGNLIKAAVSRQREFLADASAVQFTRHPAGLAGALKKIGGLIAGSRVEHPNAPEASHMFFGRATSGLQGLFSTHPPLVERIRRIEPSWDGELSEAPARETLGASAAAGAGVSGLAGAVDHIGRPDAAHIQHAAGIIRSLPQAVVEAAHEPYGARAVVYALLLDRRAAARQAQLDRLSHAADPGVYQELTRLMPLVTSLDVSARLPLLDIALPALGTLTAAQHGVFRKNVDALVESDSRLELFEWALHHVLVHELEGRRAGGPPRVRHRSVEAVRAPCEVLLSALARAGARDAGEAGAAFERAWRTLALAGPGPRPTPEDRFDALDEALAALDEAAPEVKRRVLQAAVASITTDREVTTAEAELLRAISASFGVPMPPAVAA